MSTTGDVKPALGARRALLVIHGIGGQPPLRALGAFVQGLHQANAALKRGALEAPAAFTSPLAGRRRAGVRLTSLPRVGDSLDLYEYHWAEHPVGRIGALATLAWLFGVLVAGLDFRRQLPFLMGALPARRAWSLLLKQLAQVVSLLALAVSLLLAALLVLSRAGAALLAFRRAAALLPAFPTPLEAGLLVIFACLTAGALLLTRDLTLARLEARRVRARYSGWSGMYTPAAERWALPGYAALAVTLLLAAGLAAPLAHLFGAYGAALAELAREPAVLIAAAAALLLLVARALLLSHVADIALYVTSDRVSARARTRRKILDEGEALVRELLDGGYDGVYLAGHSLGSVIALDLLDRLARGAHPSDPKLARIKGLLTFGSPLDKVAYFFRQRPGEGESARAQLLTFLHGVKRNASGMDHGPFSFRAAEPPFEGLNWLQVHAPGDLLSDSLIHYRVDRRVNLRRYNPLSAHSAYLKDADFFNATHAWLAEDGAAEGARGSPGVEGQRATAAP